MSCSSRTKPQHSFSSNIISSNTTTTTTTSRHLYHQQQYEMQSMSSPETSPTWANMYAMYQPVQEAPAQIDIRSGETQTEVLRRELLEVGLPPDLLHDVGHSSPSAGARGARADTFILRNQTTQESTEVLFDQASSGVTRNVAVRSVQVNTAVGPGSRVSRNHATESDQSNCSVCIVM